MVLGAVVSNTLNGGEGVVLGGRGGLKRQEKEKNSNLRDNE